MSTVALIATLGHYIVSFGDWEIPFARTPEAIVAGKVRPLPPPSVCAVMPSLPRQLDVFLQRAMAVAHEQRYRDAEQFAAALTDVLRYLRPALPAQPPQQYPDEPGTTGATDLPNVEAWRPAAWLEAIA